MKILAIDIGTAHIKSVIVETKFKRYDVVLQDITSVPDAWEPRASGSDQMLSDGQLSTLAEIRQRYGDGVDRIVTNLPFSLYSSRFHSFPMKERRKVMSAIHFAIEDEIPFDVDDCIVTSHLYPAVGKETDVLTGFAPISAIQRFVESLSAMGLSPDVLMAEEAALSAQFERAKVDTSRGVAVLNLGHRKSGMFFFREGRPVLHRNTMVGGFQVTEAIANRYGLGPAEAELAKVDRGFLAVAGMQLSPDQEAFSETIRGALEPIFSDFQQSMMAFNARFDSDLETIYICGGTSLLPGLAEYLSHRWAKKVQVLQPTRLFPAISIQPQRNVETLLPLATALGLSQVVGEGRSQINFRSGKLRSLTGGLDLNFQQFVYPAKLALTIYGVAMLSVIGQSIFLGRQETSREAVLDRSIKSVLGAVPTSILYSLKTNPTKLHNSVEKKVAEYKALVKGNDAGGVPHTLEFLQDLSKGVPKTATTEIKQMDYTPAKVSLTMESPDEASAHAAISALQGTSALTNSKAGPIEPKGSRKRFTISANPNPRKGM